MNVDKCVNNSRLYELSTVELWRFYRGIVAQLMPWNCSANQYFNKILYLSFIKQ